jgi:hypothetical protein
MASCGSAPTRTLYERAMSQRVPFQFYQLWIEKQIALTVRTGDKPPAGGAAPPSAPEKKQ